MYSPSAGPVKKKPRGDDVDGDADEQLDALMRLHQHPDEFELEGTDAPSWAVALQKSFQLEIRRSNDSLGALDARMTKLESESVRERKDLDRRIAALEEIVQQTAHGSHNAAAPSQGVFSRMPPPADRQGQSGGGGFASSAQSSTDTDYNHIVVGEWEDGTPRAEIIGRIRALLASHQPTLQVQDVVVYGRRGSVGHIFLSKLPGDESFQRYLTLRQHLHEKHGVESSDDTKLLWFSASKPRSVRLQNKRSMMAKSMLAPLFPDLELEVEWKKGVIWAGKSRIAAAFPVALAAKPGNKVVALSTDPEQAQALYHFNVGLIANIRGKTEPEVEAHLFKMQQS